MMATFCRCPSCTDPAAAVAADRAGLRRCDRCQEWFPLLTMTRIDGGRPQYGDVGDPSRWRCDECLED